MMPESHWRQQRSPSPKSASSKLPPLSKFYYGPAQGWTSNESSPSHTGSTWSLNEIPSTLPPRSSPGPPAHGSPQMSQGWHSPPPSAPNPSQLTNMPYMSNSYALIPDASNTPVNPTWDSGPPEPPAAALKKARHVHSPGIWKPPLPPRTHQNPDQRTSHASQIPTSRLSATTIDVPLFLQPVRYDSSSAPPIPGPIQGEIHDTHSPPQPARIPPPPPQKIPLDREDELRVSKMVPRPPHYDPQNSFDGGMQHLMSKPQRPHFDPQNSYNDLNGSSEWEHQEQQPTIPAPQFTSFDVESALPPAPNRYEPNNSIRADRAQAINANHQQNATHRASFQHLRHSSTSSLQTSHEDRQVVGAESTKRNPQATTYAPPTERQSANESRQDEQSISNTDVSSHTAGKSTPESQQTSNTSYREADPSVQEHQSDDTFYWHSGQSSSDAEEDPSRTYSPMATTGASSIDQSSSTTASTLRPNERQDLPIPARSTSLSPSMPALNGASALGFGGPSDWEYFGDYEAEEIDDEELYSRPRDKAISDIMGDSAELPADTTSAGFLPTDADSSFPSDKAEVTETSVPEISRAQKRNFDSSQEGITQDAVASHGGDFGVDSEFRSEQSPTTPIARLDQRTHSDGSPEQRLDLDEVIRAWSEAPYVGKLQDTAHVGYEGINEPPEVTEASLASTPRERVLGVDASLKDAPSMPTLSDFVGNRDSLTEQSKLVNHASMIARETPVGVRDPIDLIEEPPLSAETHLHGDKATTASCSEDESAGLDQEGYNAAIAIPVMESVAGASPTEEQKGPLSDIDSRLESSQPDELKHINKKQSQFTNPTAENDAPSLQEYTRLPQRENHHEAFGEELQRIQATEMQEKPEVESQEHGSNLPSESMKDVSEHQASATPIDKELQSATKAPNDQFFRESKETSHKALSEPSNNDTLQGSPENIQHKSSDESKLAPTLDEPTAAQPNDSFESRPAQAGANERKALTSDQRIEDFTPQPSSLPAAQKSKPDSESRSKGDKLTDPYADLDPWGKASLNRFAAMLREEARAETNKDKLNIFNVFTSRESRLRVVLYGTDDDLIIPQVKSSGKQASAETPGISKETENPGKQHLKKEPHLETMTKAATEKQSSISLQRSLKALPALPANRDSILGLPNNALAPLVVEGNTQSSTGHESPGGRLHSDEIQYSPGGRPLIPRFPAGDRTGEKQDSQIPPMASEPTPDTKIIRSPSSRASVAVHSKKSLMEDPIAPSRRNKPRSEVKSYLANRKSVIRPYATLTQGSRLSMATFGRDFDNTVAPMPNSAPAPPTSQYNPRMQSKDDGATEVANQSIIQPTNQAPDRRQFIKADFDPLLTVLPTSEAMIHEPAGLNSLRDIMEAVPDDFSFIHQSVIAWDAKAKKHREENDRQRHARQIESEQRIDSLFDDHEIGYGDISELESEFKRSEAARRADEDRSEYQTFVSDVFNLVWTRLHYELDQLIPHYEQYAKLMNTTLAGKDMFGGSADGLALAPTMTSFLTLHQKLEIRHQKAFEAVLERDRRLKKTEISPWYTLSNIAKVKQLEQQFEDAEKNAIIDYCEQRDSRANRLMDVLDQNTLRGVGANQDYMEAIMKAVRRIASGRAFASMPGSNEPSAGIEEVEKARMITALLATSSEQIVQTFHVADMLLNSADYEVEVAKAKSAKDDAAKLPSTLAQLKEARATEDQRLMGDLEHRLALIREDARKTNDEIVKLLLFLGVQNGRADSAPMERAASSELSHEARMQIALADAKRRNALKDAGT